MFFRISYPLFFRRRLETTDRCRLLGFSLVVFPTVFHPRFFFSTKLFGKYLVTLDLAGKDILEMGCGAGLLSLIAASKEASVASTDINERAVQCACSNAKENGLADRIVVFQSDLFEQVLPSSMFDYIIWNPPFFPEEPNDNASAAWKAGKDYRLISRFAEEAGHHLKTGGKVLILLTSNVDVVKILSFFTSSGFSSLVVQKQKSYFETFTIHELSFSRQ